MKPEAREALEREAANPRPICADCRKPIRGTQRQIMRAFHDICGHWTAESYHAHHVPPQAFGV